jgi:uncharacterized protein (UPF0212 family)
MSTLAHTDPIVQVDAPLREIVVLLEEIEHIEDHSVTEQASFVSVQDAGRNLMQDELVVANVDRVTRICPALVASYDVRFLGQDIDDLTLAFVTPLAADNHQAATIYTTFGHGRTFCVEEAPEGPTGRKKPILRGMGSGRCILWRKLDRLKGGVNACPDPRATERPTPTDQKERPMKR